MFPAIQEEVDLERQWLRDQINDRALVRARPGEAWPAPRNGNSPSGVYLWVFQPRRVLLDPIFAQRAARYMLEAALLGLYRKTPFQMAAMEAGGVPLGMALRWVGLEYGLDINLLTVRKEQKPYGVRNRIEGIPNDLPVLMVDDVVNSANSMARGALVIHEEGLALMPWAAGLLRRKTGADHPLTGRTQFFALFDYGEFDLHWEDYQAARAGKAVPILRNAQPGERPAMAGPPLQIEGL